MLTLSTSKILHDGMRYVDSQSCPGTKEQAHPRAQVYWLSSATPETANTVTLSVRQGGIFGHAPVASVGPAIVDFVRDTEEMEGCHRMENSG